MPWFRVDDQLAFHQKAVRAGLPAMGLWTRAGSWCAQQLTDGKVPADMLATFGATRKHATALVAAGLWHAADDGDGWVFHDWSDYQPLAADVYAERAKARDRMGKKRKRASEDQTILFGAGSDEHPDVFEECSGEHPPNIERSSDGVREPLTRPVPLSTPDGVDDAATPPERIADLLAARPELGELCEHLAARMVANGCKPPRVTARWVDAARLLLDRDQRTPEQVRAAIDFATSDEFWRANVLSMPKLREKYDQLRLAAMRDQPRARRDPAGDILRADAARAATRQPTATAGTPAAVVAAAPLMIEGSLA